jgi:hypothetical protein
MVLRIKDLFLAIFFFFLIIYLMIYLTGFKYGQQDQSSQIYSKLKLKNEFNLLPQSCDPFLKNANQFRVEIDGQTYPRIIHLYQNASINFDCLNRSREIKKILLWNPFFGHWDFAYGTGKIEPFKRHNCPVTSCEILNEKVENDFF